MLDVCHSSIRQSNIFPHGARSCKCVAAQRKIILGLAWPSSIHCVHIKNPTGKWNQIIWWHFFSALYTKNDASQSGICQSHFQSIVKWLWFQAGWNQHWAHTLFVETCVSWLTVGVRPTFTIWSPCNCINWKWATVSFIYVTRSAVLLQCTCQTEAVTQAMPTCNCNDLVQR